MHKFDNFKRLRFKLETGFDRVFPYVMVAPTIAVICALIIYPIITGIKLSFYNYTLVSPIKPYIGLENYANLLKNTRFLFILGNTVVFAVFSVIISTLIGLLVALFLNKSSKVTGVYRSIGFLPWITPSVVFAYVWVWMFSKSFSPLNDLLMRLHIIDSPIAFLGDMSIKFLGLPLPFWSVLLVRVWFSFPFKMIMFLAALQSIPQTRYDAALVDGANKLQQFFYIILPAIMPVMFVVVALSTIWNLSHFDTNYLMTGGGPQDSTNVIPIFIYNRAFIHYKMGLASAAGVIILLLAAIIGFIYMRYMTRGEE